MPDGWECCFRRIRALSFRCNRLGKPAVFYGKRRGTCYAHLLRTSGLSMLIHPSSNSSRGKLSSHGKHAGTQIRADLAPCRAYLGSVTIETRTFKTAQRRQTLLSSAAAPSHSAIEQVYGAKKRRDTSATKASAVDTGLHAKDRWITLILIFHVRVNILGTRTQCSSRTPTPNSRCASSSAV